MATPNWLPAVVILLIGCNTVLTPTAIHDIADIPSTLLQSHCPESSSLYTEDNDFICISNQTGKRHGPYLKVSSSQLDMYFYSNGELVSFPWLTIDGKLDNVRTQNFLRQELPTSLLEDFMNRYPDSDLSMDISIRVQELNYTEDTTVELCTSEVENMTCLQSHKTISRLFNVDTTFIHVGDETHFFIDNNTVSKNEVLLCQKRCQCSSGPWNSPKVSAEYCQSKHKRLPTMDELLVLNQSQTNTNVEFELSANSLITNIQNFDVIYSTPPFKSKTGVLSLASSINSQNKYSNNNDNTKFRCAHDYSLSPAFTKAPKPIQSKISIPKRDVTLSPDSWGFNDDSYQTELKKNIEGLAIDAFNFTYKNVYMINDILWNYHKNHPDVTEMYNLGTSNQGFPILGLRITSNPSSDNKKPSILINGAHHGDELLSVLYALYNIEFTLQNQDTPQVQQWLTNLDLWFIPLVNPDGNWMTLHTNSGKNIGRKNGLNTDGQCEAQSIREGVDLNRNYPFQWGEANKGSSANSTSNYFRGDSAASEPETQIMMALANREKFVAAISWHTHGTMIISPYTIPGLTNPNPDIPWLLAEDLKANTPLQPNGRPLAVKSSMYPVDGTDQDWLYHTHGTIAYIVEGSHHNPESIDLRKDSVLSIHPLYTRLLDRIVTGSAVYGYTQSEDGTPLESTVKIVGHSFSHGENWTSRQRDGLFYRLIPTNQGQTVQFSSPGYVPHTIEVPASSSPVNLHTITLKENK